MSINIEYIESREDTDFQAFVVWHSSESFIQAMRRKLHMAIYDDWMRCNWIGGCEASTWLVWSTGEHFAPFCKEHMRHIADTEEAIPIIKEVVNRCLEIEQESEVTEVKVE